MITTTLNLQWIISFLLLSSVSSAPPEQTLYTTSFDSLADWTSFDYGDAPNQIITSYSCPSTTDTVCVRVDEDQSYIQQAISTAGYHQARIVVDVSETDVNNNEYCRFGYRSSFTSSWTDTNILEGETTGFILAKDVMIPDAFTDSASLQIRLLTSSGGGRCYFDNLQVYATPVTAAPTVDPTISPTAAPTRPSTAPTEMPSASPTQPSIPPTKQPSVSPSKSPTEFPTRQPSVAPTETPSNHPTAAPTSPSMPPTVTVEETTSPTQSPIDTVHPSVLPTVSPTNREQTTMVDVDEQDEDTDTDQNESQGKNSDNSSHAFSISVTEAPPLFLALSAVGLILMCMCSVFIVYRTMKRKVKAKQDEAAMRKQIKAQAVCLSMQSTSHTTRRPPPEFEAHDEDAIITQRRQTRLPPPAPKTSDPLAVAGSLSKAALVVIGDHEDSDHGLERQPAPQDDGEVNAWSGWEWHEILEWVMSLENGRFAKYRSKIMKALCEEQVSGDVLPDVNEIVLKRWGVASFADKRDLLSHIRALVDPEHGQEEKQERERRETEFESEESDDSEDLYRGDKTRVAKVTVGAEDGFIIDDDEHEEDSEHHEGYTQTN